MMNPTPYANRRSVLFGASAMMTLAACSRPSPASAQGRYPGAAPEAPFKDSPFRKISDREWQQKLGSPSWGILRHEETERAGTGPFLNEKRKGVYHCKGCDLALFKSDWKYESNTGWPSFYDVIKGAVATKTDFLIGVPRVEYHCARCLGHQGHVFEDGPRPTGLRYCNNGYALTFKTA